MLYFKLKE